MVNFHARSKSFPSQSHPLVDDVESRLCRLKSSSEATSSSVICSNLASLKDLQESIDSMIQMPSIQQSLFNVLGEELLEGSLRLVDLCEISKNIVSSAKESVQELESSIRRNKRETATADDVKAYTATKKKINKMVNKCIKNLKSSNQEVNRDLNAVEMMLKEIEIVAFSVLRSALMAVSGEKERSKQRSWSLLWKFSHTSRVHYEDLCSSSIQEIEEGLDALFRTLIKSRVTILNVRSFVHFCK